MSGAVEEKRAVIAKIEGTYGTDSVPTGGANAIIVKNLDWTPLSPGYAARDNLALPYLGRFASKTAIKRGMIEFDVELTGAAAAGTAPPWGALMRACGMSETVSGGVSVTYAPISAAFESVSLYANIDGLQQKLLGCRGSAALRFRNEEIPLVHFRLLSLYAVPTDTALPTLTLTAHQQPVPVNKTTLVTSSLHTYSFGFQEADVDVGNVFDYQSFPNGSEQVFVTDRAPSGRVLMEHPTIAQKDFYSLVDSAATGTLTLAFGATGGNRCTITAAQTRLTNPRRSAVRGISTLELGLELAPSNAGNDEFSIAFT